MQSRRHGRPMARQVLSSARARSLPRRGRLGPPARRLGVQGCRGRRRGRRRPRIRLQSRRPSDDRVRSRREFPALLGRRHVRAAARSAHRARRLLLLHRRRRPHRAQMHARGQGVAHHRHSRQAGAVFQRRALPPLHPHRAFADRRHLRVRRLWQRAGPQVRRERTAPDVLGRARDGSRANSTSSTTSLPTPTAGSTSPIAKTIACRYSMATASTRRSGTTCTGPAGCAWATKRRRLYYIGELGPMLDSNRRFPNLGPRLSITDNKGKILGRIAPLRRRPGARAVRRAARTGGGLPRRHLRRRSFVHRVECRVSRRAQARAHPHAAEARQDRRSTRARLHHGANPTSAKFPSTTSRTCRNSIHGPASCRRFFAAPGSG